jgi:tetratricopeptide (TPR) repeat protein
MAKTSSELRAAVHAHRDGNLRNAQRLCRKVLRREPHNAGALHLLGVALAENGQSEAARACFAEAIRIGGPQAPYCANLGRLLFREKRFREAAACFRQSLRSAPLDAAVTFLLGQTLSVLGRHDEARLAFEQTLALDPGLGEAHFNLGVLHILGKRYAEARHAFARALEVAPGHIDAHNNLATLLHAEGLWDQAEAHYRSALRLSASDLRTRYNLGRLYEDRGQPETAADIYCDLLNLAPEHVAARTNFGNCLLAMARPGDAIAEYRRALEVDPGYVDAHWNLSLALLQTGQFAEGWREYEWRFRQWPALERGFEQPLWDGGPLRGRRILLHAEQGAGDTIQFARYAALVKDQGGHVILECQASLLRLLSRLPGVDEIAVRGTALPRFDCHAPLLSLPGIAGTGLSTIPAAVPYLRLDPDQAALWEGRLREPAAGFRVGLAWAGNPKHKNDRNRSLPPDCLAVLESIPGTTFFRLQTGPAGAVANLRPPMAPIADEVFDFADTAAIIHQLDLVIAVDTAVAHLAGALARPVWTLLPYAADWRWLEARSDTPWYPTMRLLRQTAPGDWAGVMDRIREELLARGA